jgi:plasmid stability protein
MANVLNRDLPDDVHARLKEKAAGAGQSLQAFFRLS